MSVRQGRFQVVSDRRHSFGEHGPPSSSSSNSSRKRKFDDASSEKTDSSFLLDSILTENLSNADAISFHFQLAYNEELELSEGGRACLLDSRHSSLQKLRNGSTVSSIFHDSKPPSSDSPAWTYFESCADQLIESSISPTTFIQNLPNYAQSNIVEVCPEEAAKHREKLALSEDYYTRILDVSREEHATRLEKQGQSYPDDLPFIMIQLQYLGFRERAESLLNRVMQGLGFPDVRVELNSSIDGVHPTLKPTYSGATIELPEDRQADDKKTGSGTSRIKNFLKVNPDAEWLIIRWIPLQQPLFKKLDWRTEETLGLIEAILIDCTQPNYNKARGGWIHSIALHDRISKPLRAMLAMLPPRRPSDPVPAEITADLNAMIDEEFALMSELEDSEGFGGIYGEPVVHYLKKEFVERIRHINGNVTCLHLVKDVPKEVGDGLISSSWCSDEAGRSVAQYRRIMRAIDDLESNENENDYEMIRSLDGPVLNFWRFPKLHKWWGLLAYLTGLYLRLTRPYAIHSWSAQMSQLLQSTILVTLPLDLVAAGTDLALQGREAMTAIDPEIVNQQHIQQTMNVPVDRNLRERVGSIQKVMIGPGKLDFSINLVKGHLGSTFYRRLYFRHDMRRFTLVHGLSVALNRITDDFAARRKTPTTQNERIKLLDEIIATFEQVARDSGVRGVLDEEIKRQRICDQAQGALLGKGVEAVEGEDETLVERPKKKKKEGEKKYARNNGVLARGDARSTARRMQLKEMQSIDLLAQKLGITPPLVGPDGERPNSLDYSNWFLDLPANLSITQSLNAHGRTPEGIQAHIDNGKRLGQLRKDWARASRARKTEIMGGWTRAEQFEELSFLLPTLRVDMTAQTFDNSPRTARCAKDGCLARVFGQGKNSKHRCNEETDPELIVKTSFDSYIRPLYAHDLFGLTDVDSDILQLVATNCHLTASPAVDWVLDQNGAFLPTVPFSVDPGVSITGLVYWDEKKPKFSPENFLMALDVVLREACPGKTPLEMAARKGKTVTAAAERLYNTKQDIVWRQGYMDELVETVKKGRGRVDGCICLQCGDVKLKTGKKRSEMVIHGPCTKGPNSGDRDQANFYWFTARKLTDLPYSMARLFLYRTMRSGDENKTKKWRGLLEWSG